MFVNEGFNAKSVKFDGLKKSLGIATAFLTLSACQFEMPFLKQKLTAIPVKIESKSNWSLVDLDGKIIVEDEWKNEPTIAISGVVRVRNDKGKYEFYTAEKKSVQIGDTYVDAGLPCDDVIPVVEGDSSSISVIDAHTGKELFAFDQAEGKPVMEMGSFVDGLARFKTSENKWGYVNTKGEVVIGAQYEFASDFHLGKAEVGTKFIKHENGADIYENLKLIDVKGKKVLEISKDRLLDGIWNEHLIPYKDGKQSDARYGLMDFKGQEVLKASDKFKEIHCLPEACIAIGADGIGFIDAKSGEQIVKPKFSMGLPLGSGFLVNDGDKVKLLDSKGEKVPEIKFDGMLQRYWGGDLVAVLDGDRIMIINSKGKQVGKDDYASVGDKGLNELYGLDEQDLVKSRKKPPVDLKGQLFLDFAYPESNNRMHRWVSISKKGTGWVALVSDSANDVDNGNAAFTALSQVEVPVILGADGSIKIVVNQENNDIITGSMDAQTRRLGSYFRDALYNSYKLVVEGQSPLAESSSSMNSEAFSSEGVESSSSMAE